MINKLQTSKKGIPFETFTGKLIYPLDLEVGDIDILDIAHSLSNLCRYGGHSEEFYSVAEHSVRVSFNCLKKDALHGLLHDASEAYLVDLPRPIKAFMPEYRQAEDQVQRIIAEKFKLNWPWPHSVHDADVRMLVTEMRDLMKHYINEAKVVKPYKAQITPMTSKQAKREFLKRFKELTDGE